MNSGENMNAGIIEIDVHGMNQFQARTRIDAALKKASSATYMIRIIHGYHGGTALKDMIRKTYRKHPLVKRVELSMNPGITELILRDF
ncbi:Smr domain-containing protein [Longibaculum muris]|uniref:Smr domain-containing protein n=2 Tax=Longibaculum muris TaxID=1796628 RepID=A0A4R3Z4Z1_9FIRM|nr:Smr domain protein [Candidatus Stoquefichus sp. KLE1796]TCW01277.1 Smr domain-containing protein [Longibaculum muris]